MICPSCGADNEQAAEVCFTCRAVLAALTQGSIVGGRFEILSPLGRGGMGAVYRAHDRVLDETVALKILRAEAASAAEMARRFRSEIKLARRVAHPHVCRIYEYGEDGPRQYISMELVEGTNLKEVLRRRGSLPAAEAFDVAIQVAEGLEAIHRVGIVHRDLKTPNVMLDPHGTARVMDFGIAKKVAGGGTPAPSGSYVVGSPEYMSPEQARGQPVDSRSDLYALGIVVFELFTGRVPFRGDTPVATLLMHLETAPPLDGPEAAAIPLPVRAVLRKALAKDPAARYGSAAEMAQALRAARDGSLGLAEAHPRWKTGRRRGPWLAIAGAIAVTLLALEAWDRWAAPAPSPEPLLPPETPAVSLSPPPPARPASEAPRSPGPPSPSARGTRTPAPSPASAEAPPAPSLAPSPPPATATSPAPGPASSSPPAVPSPTATASPTPEPDGALAVQATPWAEVSIDNRPFGPTPLRLALRPGPHDVVLTHPDFKPWRRKVTILPGRTFALGVNLPSEGVRRR
ncbi:MAG: hypothetical protein DMF81_06000 [Acidobacteria bacterium]|nr:MAG: hypothetical protein DMF81_06000 [Acidobacteriota bacterium]